MSSMARKSAGGLRHGAEIVRVRDAAVDAPGVADRDARRAAYEAGSLPGPLGPYLEKVSNAAWSVTDEDIAGLQAAGYSEDAILELTVAAAAGAAGRRYDAAVRAMRGEA
jgi:hypothetical protein